MSEKRLVKFQIWSIITQAITISISTVQNLIIVWLLTPAEYGLIGLVLSIGAFIGVYQHLGLVDGAIREISIQKKKREAAKIFWTSLFARLIITVPVSIAVYFLAEVIAMKIYHRPEIIFPLKLFAFALILQGIQGIVGAALSGLHKFFLIYLIQIFDSFFTLGVFVFLVWQQRFIGFFYALILTTIVMIFALFIALWISLQKMPYPKLFEFKKYFKAVFDIGFVLYLSKILYVFWQRMGILILGYFVLPMSLGYYNFSLVFGTKLTLLSQALSEVNLAVMSKTFSEDFKKFKQMSLRNFLKVTSFLWLIAATLMYFAKEVTIYIVGEKYIPALPIINIIIFAFLFYAVLDLISSSILVPAKKHYYRLYSFILVVVISFATILILLNQGWDIKGVALGSMLGIAVALLYIFYVIFTKLKFNLLSKELFIIILILSPLILLTYINLGFVYKILIYFSLVVIYLFYLQKKKIATFIGL